MNKFFKPIYPARDLGYVPVFKNTYNRTPVMGQKFGENMNSFYKENNMLGHNGIDIPCVKGTPVFAAHDGIVSRLSIHVTQGLGVTIRANDGSFKTIYWHLTEIKCDIGQVVKALDLIGLADSTGQSTGNHLHFGWYPADEPQNNGYDGARNPLPEIIENPTFVFNSNLWLGRSGKDVKNLQIVLAYEGFLGQVGFYGFTGYFGMQTFDALKQFQRKYGILSTGFCGNSTRQKLNDLSKGL